MRKAKKSILLMAIICLPYLVPVQSTAEPECIGQPSRSQPIEVFIDLIISKRIEPLDEDCMQRANDAAADIQYSQMSQQDSAFRAESKHLEQTARQNTWSSASKFKTAGADLTDDSDDQSASQVVETSKGYTTISR